jgi:hypothetical protein
MEKPMLMRSVRLAAPDVRAKLALVDGDRVTIPAGCWR